MSRDHFLLTTKVCKVVSLLKNFLLEGTKENICQLVNHFGIDVNGSLDQVCKFAPQLLEASHEHSGEIKYIDFDDMIYLPAKLGLVKKSFDLLIVDEAQDLNPAQHELVVRGSKQVLAVGDDKQAIYGFRGSDSNSINNLIDHFYFEHHVNIKCCISRESAPDLHDFFSFQTLQYYAISIWRKNQTIVLPRIKSCISWESAPKFSKKSLKHFKL